MSIQNEGTVGIKSILQLWSATPTPLDESLRIDLPSVDSPSLLRSIVLFCIAFSIKGTIFLCLILRFVNVFSLKRE